MNFRESDPQQLDKLIKTDRVKKTVKGGQIPSFRAVVAVGNGKGMVGVGIAKSRQTPDAIRKATEAGRKNMVKIPLLDNTIPHKVEAKVGGVSVMLKPASRGTGLVAGLGVREILEVAGVKDVLSKSQGAKNRMNRASATFEALKKLRSPEQVFAFREKQLPKRFQAAALPAEDRTAEPALEPTAKEA